MKLKGCQTLDAPRSLATQALRGPKDRPVDTKQLESVSAGPAAEAKTAKRLFLICRVLTEGEG